LTHDPTGARPDPEATPAPPPDRRRSRADGEPNPDPPDEPPREAVDPPAPGLEETVRSQAARIDELMRAYATLLEDNKAYRQRLEREKERMVEAERVRVAQSLFEALDGLELAWNASRASAGPDTPALRNLTEGVRLTLQGLAKRIGELGAERIEVLGRPFDPRVAEAVDVVVVTDPARDDVVVDEMRPGWRIGGKVLRPARVRVGRLPRA
jgi:molecular chaperone GrpE